MRLRHRDDEGTAVPASADDGRDDEQTAAPDQTAALLAAAHDAIDRALSGNSVRFLEQNRQAGGQ